MEVEISVNYDSGTIELVTMKSQGQDWLDVYARFLLGGRIPMEELIVYLWPGVNELTWRYVLPDCPSDISYSIPISHVSRFRPLTLLLFSGLAPFHFSFPQFRNF